MKPASPELTAHCAQLAIENGIAPPVVRTMSVGSSHVVPRCFRPPVVSLASAELDALDDEERDALILHELHHVRQHTGPLGLLLALSTFTQGARGVLTILLDPRQAEYDADDSAVQVLNRRDDAGQSTVSRMLSKLDAVHFKTRLRTTTGGTPVATVTPSGWRFLADLLFGDGDSWYQHPTMTERLQAINRTRPATPALLR
jgi:Zn-dependent protease with chaperone function